MPSSHSDSWRFGALGLATGFALASLLGGLGTTNRTLSSVGSLALIVVAGSSWAVHRSRRLSLHAEMRLREIVESAPDAMFIVDKKGLITLVNAQAEVLFGWPRQELLGQPIELLVPNSVRPKHAHMRDDYHGRPHRRPMNSGLELMGQRRDGSIVPVQIALSPMTTSGNAEVIAAVRDSTERYAAAEALRTAHAEATDLYEHAPCGYHTLDAELRYLRVNETELAWLGYTREEMIGRPVSDFQTARSQERLRAVFADCGLHTPIDHVEAEFVRKDGSILPVLLSGCAMLDEHGNFVCRRATLLDMTELREERDAREQRIKEALAEVQTLHGLLPICAWCKKIRGEDGSYLPMETYLHQRTGVAFSHGMCPDCLKGMVDDIDRQGG